MADDAGLEVRGPISTFSPDASRSAPRCIVFQLRHRAALGRQLACTRSGPRLLRDAARKAIAAGDSVPARLRIHPLQPEAASTRSTARAAPTGAPAANASQHRRAEPVEAIVGVRRPGPTRRAALRSTPRIPARRRRCRVRPPAIARVRRARPEPDHPWRRVPLSPDQ